MRHQLGEIKADETGRYLAEASGAAYSEIRPVIKEGVVMDRIAISAEIRPKFRFQFQLLLSGRNRNSLLLNIVTNERSRF